MTFYRSQLTFDISFKLFGKTNKRNFLFFCLHSKKKSTYFNEINF